MIIIPGIIPKLKKILTHAFTNSELWNIPKYTATITLNRPNTYVALWCLSFVWNLVKHEMTDPFFPAPFHDGLLLFFFPPLVLLVSDYFLASTHHEIFEVLPLSRTAASCIKDRDFGLVCNVGMCPQLESHYLYYKYDLFDGSLWRKCWNNLSVRDGAKPLFLEHSSAVQNGIKEGRNAYLHPFALIF